MMIPDRNPRAKNSCQPRLVEGEMTTFYQPQHEDFFPPTDVNDYYGPQNVGAENPSAECLKSRYLDPQTAIILTEFPTSTDLHPINTMADFDAFNNLFAFHSNSATSPNLTQGTELMIPPAEPPSFLPQDQYVNSKSRFLTTDLNNHAICSVLDDMAAAQTMPKLSTCLSSANDILMWNELKNGNEGLQSLTNNSFPVTSKGVWERTADSIPGHATNDTFFENASRNTADVDFFYNHLSRQTPTFYYPPQPPTMTVDYNVSSFSWPPASSTSGDLNLLFQSEPGWNVVDEEQRAEVLSRPLLNGLILGELPPYAANSVSSAISNTSCEPGPYPLALFSESTSARALPRLEPKLTTSLDTLAASEQKVNSLQGLPKPQRQKTPWSPERRRRTRMMRREGACFFCRLSKTRCSGLRGEICEPCIGKPMLCLRDPLPELRNIFCPPFAFGHLEVLATERWIEKGRLVSADDDILIKVSLYSHLGSMSFNVHEILSASPDFLLHPGLLSNADDKLDNFTSTLWLPFALSTFDIPRIKLKCEEYIKTISKCPMQILESLDDNTSVLVWRSLKAVYKFLECNLAARQNCLLYDALKLYWTLFSLGRNLHLDTESTIAAVRNLKNPLPPILSQSCMSARVFARQVKTAMSLIYQDLLAKVLEGLEQLSKSDTVIASVISFCTNIVLCFIVEELEMAIDGLGIYKISQGEDPILIPQRGGECCKLLEQVLTNYSWAVFFKKSRKYNVIRDGCLADNMSGQNEGVAGLSEDFCEILQDLEHEIGEKAGMTYVAASAALSDHKDFCTRNSGRHIATYLQRFTKILPERRQRLATSQ